MAFLNEQGLSKLWGIIKTLVSSTESSLQGKIDKKLDESTYNSQINAGVKNPNTLKVKVNEETSSYDYDGSKEIAISFKSGTGISIDRTDGAITIEATGDAIAENATNATNATFATYDASQNGKDEKVTIDTRFTNLQTLINNNANTNAESIGTINTNIGTLQTGVAENKAAAEKAQGDATQALTNAATADGKAVAAQGTANTALANAATAQSTANEAKGIAEQKTTMAEVTTVLNDYATKEYADTAETDAINAAKGYTDGQIALLLDNPDTDINSIKELSAAIKENDTAIDALNTIAGTKVSKETKVIAGTGLSGGGVLSGDITLTNTGVRSIATGSTNGTISVNTNGSSAEVAVAGLGTAAYKADIYFATTTSVSGLSTTVDNLSTSKQDKLVNSDDITIGTDNKLTIAAIPDSVIEALA